MNREETPLMKAFRKQNEPQRRDDRREDNITAEEILLHMPEFNNCREKSVEFNCFESSRLSGILDQDLLPIPILQHSLLSCNQKGHQMNRRGAMMAEKTNTYSRKL